MLRRWIALAVLAVCPWSVGCTMCQSPYDYCGPVVDGDCGPCGGYRGESCDYCQDDDRRSSSLSNGQVGMAEEVMVEPTPTPAAAPDADGYYEPQTRRTTPKHRKVSHAPRKRGWL